MPAKPLSDETLYLIDAVRNALEGCSDMQEKRMFGCHVFMVNGKLCLGVEGDEVLVRLLPATHAEVAEMPGVRPLSSRGLMDGYFYIGPSAYATREQWQHWINAALAYNPLAKASPKKTRKAPPAEGPPTLTGQGLAKSKGQTNASSAVRARTKPPAAAPVRKHSVFDDDDLL